MSYKFPSLKDSNRGSQCNLVCICSYKAICIIEIKTNTTNNLTNKGIALLIIEKYNEAIRFFDKVLAINPSDPKNIPDNKESRRLLYDLGLEQVNGDVQSMKMTAMDSLAKSDKRSNVV
ncbi:MAG: tetratricopeptide repeat protein [Nitrososphaeraceae archaeon]